MDNPLINDEETFSNYIDLKKILEQAFEKVKSSTDLREAKGYLIEAQSHFKGLKLRYDDREQLYGRLQEAFADINKKIEDERLNFEKEAKQNYALIKTRVEEVFSMAEHPVDYRQTWDKLVEVQSLFKGKKLLHDQRETLYSKLQQAFDLLRSFRETERIGFEKESLKNYEQLKMLVAKGLVQAKETTEYKETREFLKKIQLEFKGIKLTREQREELYARLQSAFDMLNTRLDEYFHQKKKNWEVKMQYKLSELSAEITATEENLEEERANLRELEDQLDIVSSAGKDKDAIAGLKARIASAKMGIERKEQQIRDLEMEMNELKNRLEPEE